MKFYLPLVMKVCKLRQNLLKKRKLDAFKNVHLKYALPYGVYEKIVSGVDTFDEKLDITNGVPKITDKLIFFWQLQFSV